MNKLTTAFPAHPVQDNFGKVFTPFPGLTKYEYVLLQFAAQGASQTPEWPENMTGEQIAAAIMEGAKVLTEAYFNALEAPQADQPAPIINLVK